MAILPIVTYNEPVLREQANPLKEDSPELQALVDDMLDTMYNASGVGLAAPQIGKPLQLFVMDADVMTEETEEPEYGPMVFINPQIVRVGEEQVWMEEGCLSIPEVRDEVERPAEIVVSYLDRNFEQQEATYTGWPARVIQHEYDHLQGVLFLDYLSMFRKRLHRSRLKKIDAGIFETEYPQVPKSVSKPI